MPSETKILRGIERCPKCSEELYRDEVDIGVGVIHGPYGCSNCGWSESPEYDCLNGPCEAQKDYPGRVVDQFGSAHSPQRMMEERALFEAVIKGGHGDD